MSHVMKEDILKILSTIEDPVSKQDVVSTGVVSSIIIKDGNVGFALECKQDSGEVYELLRRECEDKVASLPGVSKVTVVLTSHDSSPAPSKKSAPSEREVMPIRHVKHIIAVGSGKGGVGKSTVAAHLALALSAKGLNVGLADADIYGPSVPKLFKIKQEPEVSEGKQMLPVESLGIKTMSMGYLLPDDTATIWRGSMATKALHQILRATEWGIEEKPLDILVIDLPPGTGDIHLTLCQQYPIDGAIIVSTPQELSLLDVKKAINMFNKVHIPILGLVENMSYFEDPDTGKKNYVFGESVTKPFAQEYGVNFMGSIPLDSAFSQLSQQEDGVFTGFSDRILSALVSK